MLQELPKVSSSSEQLFDAFVNEVSDPVTICGFSYRASDALKILDPENYSALFEAWTEHNAKPKLEVVR